jgi:hypothetical protein
LNARQIGAAKSDVKGCGNLIANSKQVPPLAKVALEAHALSDPKRRDHASFDLLAGLSGTNARAPILSPGLIKMGDEPIGLQGRRLKESQQFLENDFRFLDLLNQPRPVHIVIFHDIPDFTTPQ